jgi:hypothetical protein
MSTDSTVIDRRYNLNWDIGARERSTVRLQFASMLVELERLVRDFGTAETQAR